MYSLSQFHLLVRQIPRGIFDASIRRHQTDKHTKSFSTWDHLLAMVYAQLSGVTSLRDVVHGFNAQQRHHFHLGTQCVRRSTLADANSHRKHVVFQELAESLMSLARRKMRQDVRGLLQILDSTSFTLTGRNFEQWCPAHRTRNTQGMKLHVQYQSADALPVRARITVPTCNDITVAHEWPIESGQTYVFDKGYYSFQWWYDIDQAGSTFVTRPKRNAALGLVKTLKVSKEESAAGILSQELVRFTNSNPGGGRKNPYIKELRRISVQSEHRKHPITLITNDLTSNAEVIADIYRERWQVEFYFKWIKQHLRIKRFFGETENAVRIQILTALIAYLLVAISHKAENMTESLWRHLSAIRSTLFQRLPTDVDYYERAKRRREEFESVQMPLPI